MKEITEILKSKKWKRNCPRECVSVSVIGQQCQFKSTLIFRRIPLVMITRMSRIEEWQKFIVKITTETHETELKNWAQRSHHARTRTHTHTIPTLTFDACAVCVLKLKVYVNKMIHAILMQRIVILWKLNSLFSFSPGTFYV